MAGAYIFVEELNMDESRECALEAARRILNAGRTETPPTTNSQLLLDLAEMIRQRMAGEKLLEENSRWFLFPACGMPLGHWLTGHSL
jgi:hypothetical protein